MKLYFDSHDFNGLFDKIPFLNDGKSFTLFAIRLLQGKEQKRLSYSDFKTIAQGFIEKFLAHQKGETRNFIDFRFSCLLLEIAIAGGCETYFSSLMQVIQNFILYFAKSPDPTYEKVSYSFNLLSNFIKIALLDNMPPLLTNVLEKMCGLLLPCIDQLGETPEIKQNILRKLFIGLNTALKENAHLLSSVEIKKAIIHIALRMQSFPLYTCALIDVVFFLKMLFLYKMPLSETLDTSGTTAEKFLEQLLEKKLVFEKITCQNFSEFLVFVNKVGLAQSALIKNLLYRLLPCVNLLWSRSDTNLYDLVQLIRALKSYAELPYKINEKRQIFQAIALCVLSRINAGEKPEPDMMFTLLSVYNDVALFDQDSKKDPRLIHYWEYINKIYITFPTINIDTESLCRSLQAISQQSDETSGQKTLFKNLIALVQDKALGPIAIVQLLSSVAQMHLSLEALGLHPKRVERWVTTLCRTEFYKEETLNCLYLTSRMNMLLPQENRTELSQEAVQFLSTQMLRKDLTFSETSYLVTTYHSNHEKFSPGQYDEVVKSMMRRNEAETSQLEIFVYEHLKSLMDKHSAQKLHQAYYHLGIQHLIDIVYVDPKDGIKVAIEVDGPSHFRSDGSQTRKTQERDMMLEAHGFKVVSIHYKEWNKLLLEHSQAEERTSALKYFLYRRLKKVLPHQLHRPYSRRERSPRREEARHDRGSQNHKRISPFFEGKSHREAFSSGSRRHRGFSETQYRM